MGTARSCRYIHTFQSGFDEGLRDVQLSFMQSDGGLTPVSRFSGHKAILSGPAGGCGSLCPSRRTRLTAASLIFVLLQRSCKLFFQSCMGVLLNHMVRLPRSQAGHSHSLRAFR